MGLDEFVDELISGRITHCSTERRAEYTANNGPKVYCMDLRISIAVGECGRALAQQGK